MGIYLNPGNDGFRSARAGRYVDKSGLIAVVNDSSATKEDQKHYLEFLRSLFKMAYFAYRDYYLQFEELPGGTGYADIVYLPKKYSDYPALIIELKWADAPETAIHQIKSRNYPDVLKNFDGDILLVGISYDKEDQEKKHHCTIEVLE